MIVYFFVPVTSSGNLLMVSCYQSSVINIVKCTSYSIPNYYKPKFTSCRLFSLYYIIPCIQRRTGLSYCATTLSCDWAVLSNPLGVVTYRLRNTTVHECSYKFGLNVYLPTEIRSFIVMESLRWNVNDNRLKPSVKMNNLKKLKAPECCFHSEVECVLMWNFLADKKTVSGTRIQTWNTVAFRGQGGSKALRTDREACWIAQLVEHSPA